MKKLGDIIKNIIITRAEWNDFFTVQMSGRMNMLAHPNVEKFMPDGNWQKAHDHFERDGNETPLVIAPKGGDK